jgi:Transposase DDE domain
MHTPFFPAFRSRMAALGQRTVRCVRQITLAQLQQHLGRFVPSPLLSSEDEGLNSRERAYSLRLTFECFVWQMLKPKTSCREVVRQVQALFRLNGGPRISQEDSAYIQARNRLPIERMEKALSATAGTADRLAGSGGCLGNRPIKVVDGSTLQLPDTRPNQKAYPQPGSQKKGCGFPIMRFLALLSLNSGAILKIITDSLKHHELSLFHRMWEHLLKGDIVLGDRAYGEYTTAAALPRMGVDLVARLHYKRKVDFRKARRLGSNDGLFVWKKGSQQSQVLSAAEWNTLPEEITVRIIRFRATIRGFRGRRVTLVTTLLDPVLYPAEELAALYARRWFMELSLRSIKSTMGLEWLNCKSPEMARKELLACLIAYNLIRCVMAEAATFHKVELQRISFKGAVDALRQYSAAIAQARNRKLRLQLWEDLLLNLARDLVPHRPHRREPRAVKRRPKAYPLLNQPRTLFVEISHRNRYWKGRPRNYRSLN